MPSTASPDSIEADDAVSDVGDRRRGDAAEFVASITNAAGCASVPSPGYGRSLGWAGRDTAGRSKSEPFRAHSGTRTRDPHLSPGPRAMRAPEAAAVRRSLANPKRKSARVLHVRHPASLSGDRVAARHNLFRSEAMSI